MDNFYIIYSIIGFNTEEYHALQIQRNESNLSRLESESVVKNLFVSESNRSRGHSRNNSSIQSINNVSQAAGEHQENIFNITVVNISDESNSVSSNRTMSKTNNAYLQTTTEVNEVDYLIRGTQTMNINNYTLDGSTPSGNDVNITRVTDTNECSDFSNTLI